MSIYHRMSRRRFLQWAGWMSGGALAAPVAPWLPAGGLEGTTGRVGLLLPAAANGTGPAAQFARSFQLGFASVKRPLDLTIAEGVTTPGRSYEAIAPMLKTGLRTFVWLSDSPLSTELRRRVEDAGAVLLMSGPGANLQRVVDESPYVFHHDLGLWQGAWALGAWAAEKLGKRVSIISSFYESGYDVVYAFQLGFESVGGEVLRTRVTLRDGDVHSALAQARADRPDAIAGFYSGTGSGLFLRAYASAGLGSIPLVGPGFLTDELSNLAALPGRVYTALGWASAMKGAHAYAFANTHRRTWGDEPGPFDLLGYEAAGLVDAALRRCEAGSSGASHLYWQGLTITTPRGKLYNPAGTQQFNGPLHLRLARPGLGGYANELVSNLAAPPASNAALRELRASLKTGFTSVYLYQ